MQTCCPKCTTVYNVTEDQLIAAESKVRCAKCKNIFDGRRYLVDQARKKSLSTEELSLTEFNQFIKSPPLATSKPTWWWLAISLFVLIFIFQWLWLKKDALAEHPALGGPVKQLCHHLPLCTIQAKRNLGAFTLTSRQVYSHPNEDKALILSASFSNDANFAQPFPVLLVSMSDKQGKVIAERYFTPEEYRLLSDTILEENVQNISNIDDNRFMNMSESININLALSDPGKDALAFEIDFL